MIDLTEQNKGIIADFVPVRKGGDGMYFFDLDGTVLDSNGVWLDIDIEFLGRLGIDPVPDEYTDFVSHNSFNASAHYTRQHYAPHMTVGEIVAGWQALAAEHYAHHLPLKPGAKELVTALKGRGERVALLTSCMPDLCDSAMTRHGMLGLFDGVYYSHALNIEKSDPALYRLIAQKENLPCEQCIMLDDSPDYLAAAKEAGWQIRGVYDLLFDHRREEMIALCGKENYFDSMTSYLTLH